MIAFTPRRFADQRGWFMESYNRQRAAELGIDVEFVQDNHSLSRPVGTVRGLHFQTPPHAQAKLIRCLRGAIFDVAVDLRRGSPSYGKWVGCELSAENGTQLFVPVGFAHGFVTLEDDCEVAYKTSAHYAPDCDAGLAWDDADIAVDWGLGDGTTPVLSGKDTKLPKLTDFDTPFAYDGAPLQPLAVPHRSNL